MKPVILSLLLLLLSLSSCISTRTVATWEKEDIGPVNYTKLLVFCNASTFAARSVFERRIAKEFTAAGLTSVTASDKLPNLTVDSLKTPGSIVTSASAVGADALLYVTIGGTTEAIVSNTSTGLLDNKVSTSNQRTSSTKIESKLIDAKNGVLIMSVDTETNANADLTDTEDLAGSLARELKSQLGDAAIANIK